MVDRRRRDETDPLLDWKVRIFFAGAVLLMAGILLQRDVLALIAAVVLGIGTVMMMISRIRERRREEPPHPDSWLGGGDGGGGE
jgi:hypothetical protein